MCVLEMLPDSLEAFRHLLSILPQRRSPADKAILALRARAACLTKPPQSLGRLETLTEWCAAWSGQATPVFQTPSVFLCAGDHGVAARGVSAYHPEVTKQMVQNFRTGGAAITQICAAHHFAFNLIDLTEAGPTADISKADAMDESGLLWALLAGMQNVFDHSYDFLGIGEMGIGNTTSAAALFYALFGGTAQEWVGYGTGIDPLRLLHKQKIVAEAVARLFPGEERIALCPLEILRRLGGYEIAAMVGILVAARVKRIPVVLDGFISCSAAAILWAMAPDLIAHCQAGHVSAEKAHARVLAILGKEPILNLGLRLGEGTGAALAMQLIRTALATHAGMASFESAGVNGTQMISSPIPAEEL